jgi:hypothetical protein
MRRAAGRLVATVVNITHRHRPVRGAASSGRSIAILRDLQRVVHSPLCDDLFGSLHNFVMAVAHEETSNKRIIEQKNGAA